MSWCVRTSFTGRLTAIAAIVLMAAGSATVAAADSESAHPAEAAGPGLDQASADKDAAGAGAAERSSAQPASREHARVRAGGSLQHRLDVLSKALQLDARQRTELLAILESQRQAVRKIWSDPQLLPAERTPATRALEERTADQIRSMLSEEQRKLYNPPKPQGAEPPPPDVEGWMKKQAQARQSQ